MEPISTQINFIQNIDTYVTNKCSYLLIHKNACSEIKTHLQNNSTFIDHLLITTPINSPLPHWTCIRDPYERFISGLSYDLFLNYKDANLELILNNIDFKELFLSKLPIQLKSKDKGHLSHTILQWTYLFNQNLDFYVDIKDLDLFLDMHFPKRENKRNNVTPIEYKEFLSSYIESNPNLKNLINQYISSDYYIIDQIHNSGLLWNWQDGKMF